MNTTTDDQANASTPFWLTYANEEAQARLNELNALRYRPFIWLPDVIREANRQAVNILKTLMSSPLEPHWARTLSVTILLPIIGALFCFSSELYLRRSFHLSSPALWHGAIWWLLWMPICLDYLFWVRIVQGNAVRNYQRASQSHRGIELGQRLQQEISSHLSTSTLSEWQKRYREDMPQLTRPPQAPLTMANPSETSTNLNLGTELNGDEIFLQLTEAIRETERLSAELKKAINTIREVVLDRTRESHPTAIKIIDGELDASVTDVLKRIERRSERNEWIAAAAVTVYARLSLARARSER